MYIQTGPRTCRLISRVLASKPQKESSANDDKENAQDLQNQNIGTVDQTTNSQATKGYNMCQYVVPQLNVF